MMTTPSFCIPRKDHPRPTRSPLDAPRRALLVATITIVAAGCSDPQPPTQTSTVNPQLTSPTAPKNAATSAATAITLEQAGDRESRAGNLRLAEQHFAAAIKKSQPASAVLFEKLAHLQARRGKIFAAADTLRIGISTHPDSRQFRVDFAGLLASTGQMQEASGHLKWLVQRGFAGVNELIMLSDLARPQTDEALCNDALQRYPADRRPLFSLAMFDLYEQNWGDAKRKLEDVVQTHPNFAPAWAGLIQCYVELDDDEATSNATTKAPDQSQTLPAYWIAAGAWATRQGDHDGAVDAFTRAARIDQNHGEVLNRLSAALAQSGQHQQAVNVANRAETISALRGGIDTLLSWRRNSQRSTVLIAKALHQLGRRWEAVAWIQAGSKMNLDPDPSLKAAYTTIRNDMTGSTPWQTDEELVAGLLSTKISTKFSWTPKTIDSPLASSNTNDVAKIQMIDEATPRGLQHICEIANPDAKEAGLKIFQSGSGGIGVIDFDLDGYQDIYATRADGSPKQETSATNGLYRNRSGLFNDVTLLSFTTENGYSQGVAIGDLDSDGFSDVYVASIGANRIFVNNGDGTFSRKDSVGPAEATDWTSSVAIADLDADGIADLFDVGYCGGDLPYTQECLENETGAMRICQPLVFPAQQDRVYRGIGDGRFAETTERWLGTDGTGHGLGIIVGRLDADSELDIYVANDMTANNLWSKSKQEGSESRLVDQAAIRGLAYDARSLSQASMGIAAGDADNDGDFDLFLTHFSDDHNTYYENVGDGLWVDNSNRSGLAKPSLAMLGFGTQWIDFENDGDLELVVTNGHVDDFSHQDQAFRMPMQVFDSTNNGRWLEVDRKKLGGYFEKDMIGRALVTLDANRDGRTDVAVTHLFDPVALLINSTPDAGASISFHLTATDSHRDAVGAIVDVTTDAGHFFAQRFAGNGYQCSNEQCIRIGVGTATSIHSVRIQWPGGRVESFSDLVPGAEYAVVEGDEKPFLLATPAGE